MNARTHSELSRRERQIMDVVYRLGSVTAQQVLEELADPPSYSSVRAQLRILEGKDYMKHVGPALYVIDSSNIKTFDRGSSLAPDGFRPTFTVE